MPSKTAKQAKFMRAVAHSPKFAKKVGVSQSVGKEFEMADKKMKKFGEGGSAKKPSMPKEPASGGASTVPLTPERKKFLAEMERRNREARAAGAADAAKNNPDRGRAKGGKVVKKYAAGGITKEMPTAKEMGNLGMAKGGKVKGGMMAKAGRAMVNKSADAMGRAMVKKAKGGKCYAKGGSVDGIARKGKTKGRVC